MKRFLLLIFFISLIGCSKNPHATESGSGNIEISITLPSTKSARSGDEIKSLRIWLVDKNGKIARVITSAAGSPAAGVDGITMTGAGTASAQFINVERASYTLYFVANSDALDSYLNKTEIDNNFKKATIDYDYGFDDDNGMPLSVVKEIHVVPGKNKVSASLVRICAKIHVTVRNSTLDKMIWIKDISLNDIRPDKTYLFEQDSFFPGAVYEELEKMTNATGLAPNDEMTCLTVYLFETDKAPGIKIRGGVFASTQVDTPKVITKNISSYSFEETSESLNEGNRYLVMNKSMRYLLKGHKSGSVGIDFLASGDGPKNHLLASSDIEDYIWTYESQYVSWWTTYYDLKNIGQNKYLRNSSGKLDLGTSIDNFTFKGDKTNGYTISSGGNYIWNNAGTLDFNNKGKSPQNQWYFYKVNSVTTTEEVFDGAEPLINYSDNDLSHIDPDLGVAVPLQRIKRNESIDIRVNIFFNKNTGKLDFETEIWEPVNNETTFD